jgi:hypothetical protein
MNAYWVNIGKAGDPNGPGLPGWSRHQASGHQIIDFRPDGALDCGRICRGAEVGSKDWERVAAAIGQR